MANRNEIAYDVDGNCYIEITSKTHGVHLCPVDEDDLPLIQQYRWCVAKDDRRVAGRDLYVMTTTGGQNIKLHQLLMADKLAEYPGYQIDHISSDPRDNRRANLRIVSHSENQWHRPNAKGYHQLPNGKYKASIRAHNKLYYLGTYDTPEEARDAYLNAKDKLHIIAER